MTGARERQGHLGWESLIEISAKWFPVHRILHEVVEEIQEIKDSGNGLLSREPTKKMCGLWGGGDQISI